MTQRLTPSTIARVRQLLADCEADNIDAVVICWVERDGLNHLTIEGEEDATAECVEMIVDAVESDEGLEEMTDAQRGATQ